MKAIPSAILALAVLVVGAAGPAWGRTGPTVVELFTSQGCYSCPPAEALLGKLAGRRDLVALEFHVDYWDTLVYGSAGRWKDPFSSAAHTRRQRAYSRIVGRRNYIYTPQMVIDGRYETSGGRRGAVLSLIHRAASDNSARLRVKVSRGADGGFSIAVDGTIQETAPVWLVRFRRAATTRVAAGENKGKTLVNHNIVTSMHRIGLWRGWTTKIRTRGIFLAAGEGCAILVQSIDTGPILGAAACPSTGPAIN